MGRAYSKLREIKPCSPSCGGCSPTSSGWTAIWEDGRCGEEMLPFCSMAPSSADTSLVSQGPSATAGSHLGPSSRPTLFQSYRGSPPPFPCQCAHLPGSQKAGRGPIALWLQNISFSYIKLALGAACQRMWGRGVSLHFCRGMCFGKEVSWAELRL